MAFDEFMRTNEAPVDVIAGDFGATCGGGEWTLGLVERRTTQTQNNSGDGLSTQRKTNFFRLLPAGVVAQRNGRHYTPPHDPNPPEW
jgi:hypothetical protein